MSHTRTGQPVVDLVHCVENLGRPRVLVVGDLILDRYIWGDVERVSQEAPVPILRADHREHRLGGAASVAAMASRLGAEVTIIGVVGSDSDGAMVRRLLANHAIDDHFVSTLDSRPTTLKERYIGRAQDRHPQQMMRVDHEVCDMLALADEQHLCHHLATVIEAVDIVLVSDYDKGVCTPSLLRELIAVCRKHAVPVIIDPSRDRNYSRYYGASCLTPNRVEAMIATGMAIVTTEDALTAGRILVNQFQLEAALVTLDRDGMALVRRDGRSEIVPTRPRQVYDITGAGDMVLSVVGLCLAAGADYDEAAALGNVAGGLEVEKIGVALLSREDILRDLFQHHQPERSKRPPLGALQAEVRRRQRAGQRVVFTNGCFDLLHVGHARLLRQAASLGDYLVVGLNSDTSVRRLKGDARPINGEDARAELLSSLACVDAVTIFGEDTPLDLIQLLKPDVLVKGGDYSTEEIVGRDEVAELVVFPLVEGYSTTRLAWQQAD
jgi:D-beta-D-heptose 7-phosphate kinase/D-beta-D-heptose 1-phosphate adenosyltransferase